MGDRGAGTDTIARDMDQAIDGPGGAESRTRRPDWFHRDHPVFFPLAGFFTGMVSIIVVPGLFAGVIKAIAGYERAEQLFPFVLLLLVVPIGLLVPHHTRRFARYLLLGMVATIVVVAGAAALVLWILLLRDG